MKETIRRGCLIIVMICLAAFCLCACGQSENVITGNSSQAAASAVQSSENSAEAKNETDQSANQEQNGYVFQSGEVSVIVDAEADAIISALGEPLSYFEAASCAFEGIDKFYTYSGFEIDTYPEKEKDYISMIVLKDDSVSTPEGLAIGDEAKKVTDLYGSATESSDTLLVYEKDEMKLRVIIKDGSVQSIEYVSLVLE